MLAVLLDELFVALFRFILFLHIRRLTRLKKTRRNLHVRSPLPFSGVPTTIEDQKNLTWGRKPCPNAKFCPSPDLRLPLPAREARRAEHNPLSSTCVALFVGTRADQATRRRYQLGSLKEDDEAGYENQRTTHQHERDYGIAARMYPLA